jgi:hypothetical protein
MSEQRGAERVRLGRRRLVWADGRPWWRTYTVGGFDGYRSFGQRLPCGEVERLWLADRGLTFDDVR